MNLKERGVTVGDLLIVLIILILSIFIINNIKDEDKQAHLFINNKEILTTKMP